jgi:hypothetical protein
MLIPFMYVCTSVALDMVLQVSIFDSGLLPKHYFLSFAIICLFALCLSCIRSHIVQFIVALIVLFFKSIVVVSNYIGYSSINEPFVFQTVRAMGEIFKAHDGSPLGIIVQVVTIILLIALFSAVGITTYLRHKGRKSGYPLRHLAAVLMAATVIIGTQSVYCNALGKYTDNIVDNMLSNTRYNYDSFQNKFYYMTTFGSTMFYVRNFLDVSHIQTAKFPEIPSADNYEFTSNDGADYYGDYEYRIGGERATNLIMLMMETFEAAALNPVLTPTLWEIKGMSTSINGYHGIERTCMTEYASLVGSHLLTEMWRDFGGTEMPQALPAIFKRSGYESVNAFHAFEKGFYGRDELFPTELGFDTIYDPTDFGVKLVENKGKMNHNSDTVMFEKMAIKMAPADKSFFSYILNISTHYPHFGSTIVTPIKNQFDAYGYPKYESVFQTSLDEIYENYEALRDAYSVKLTNATVDEHNAIFTYMVGCREYDNGVKILLDRLKSTDEIKNGEPTGKKLIDTTALVLYSDHYNYTAYLDPRNTGGGLLSDNFFKQPVGEDLAFMFYNPVLPVELRGETIERPFMSNMDIYKTVCHLFNIETSTKYTLGVSALYPESFSIGVGFSTGIYFGYCPDAGVYFTTRDFKKFITDIDGAVPSAATIAKCRERLDTIFHAMQAMDKHYKRNTFKYLDDCKYSMIPF